MKYPRPSQRYALAAVAVLVFIMLGLSIPILVGGRPQSIVLQSAAVHAAPRDRFIVTTPIQLRTSPNVFLLSGTVAIVTDRSRGPLSGEAVAAMIAGGNARIVLDDATVVIETEGSTDSPEALAAPLLAALAKLQFSTLAIRRGVIQLKRAGGGTEALSDVRIEIVHRRDSALTATGSFELQGRQLKLDATLGLVSDRKDAVRLPLKASVKGAFIDASIADGRLVIGNRMQLLAGQAEVTTTGVRNLAGWLGAPWPGERGLGAFTAKGRLDWLDRTMTFHNASFQMDGNEATGTLALGWGSARPSIEGTLALKKVDLSGYTAPAKAGTFMERTFLGWLSTASEPGSLALPLLRHLDADLRLSADQVKAGGLTFGRSAASVSVKDSKLLADIAEVEIESDGNMRGQITVDMSGLVPRYVMRGKLEAVDAAKATGIVFGHPVLGGRANIMFDLTGNGESIDQLAATLHGKTGIELPEGGNIGLDLGQLGAAASKTVELKGWGAAGRGQTRVTNLVSRFGVQSGSLFAESFKATLGDRLMTLSGEIDLRTRNLDTQVSVVKLVGSGPIQEMAPNEPTEIIGVRGPWREPAIRYTTRPGKAAAPLLPPAPAAGSGRQPG